MSSRWRAGTLGIAWALAPAVLAAQVTTTLDAGGSVVEYDGFLASGSLFLTPTIRFQAPGAALAAQGTYLLFESGNRIIQGTAAGAWLPAVSNLVRPEFAGSVGFSDYTEAPTAGHLLGRVRFHVADGRRGGWVGGALARSFFGGTAHASYEAGAGAWMALAPIGIAVAATYSRSVDTSFVDFTANAHGRLPAAEIEGLVGTRTLSTGGGAGAYGEVSLRVRLAGPAELLLSAGRYPSDPVRGTLGGEFASVGMRLTARHTRRRPSAALIDLLRREPRATETVAPAGAPALRIGPMAAGLRAVRVVVPGARAVELAADFTDWEPVPLRRLAGDEWEIVLPLTAGAHRVNVRVDGGPWLAPRGARVERDEFGGVVGVVVVW